MSGEKEMIDLEKENPERQAWRTREGKETFKQLMATYQASAFHIVIWHTNILNGDSSIVQNHTGTLHILIESLCRHHHIPTP